MVFVFLIYIYIVVLSNNKCTYCLLVIFTLLVLVDMMQDFLRPGTCQVGVFHLKQNMIAEFSIKTHKSESDWARGQAVLLRVLQ